MITNLAQFKDFLRNGGAVELINFSTYSDNYKEDGSHEGVNWNDHKSHRGYGIVRKAELLQSKNVKLEGGSWLDLDPAKCWTFEDGLATRTEIREQWQGGYPNERDDYEPRLYKRSEHGNRLVYRLEA